jgi:hypothetical protein
MLLESLRALYLAPGGAGSIWKYLGALVRSTRVSGRFACGFWTGLHFADALAASRWTNWCLRSCCVPIIDVLDEVSANRLDLDLLGPG